MAINAIIYAFHLEICGSTITGLFNPGRIVLVVSLLPKVPRMQGALLVHYGKPKYLTLKAQAMCTRVSFLSVFKIGFACFIVLTPC